MNIEILTTPLRFRLHGLSSAVEGRCYGEVGCRLMDPMWGIVKGARLANTGVNHWVYFADERMFVGVELSGSDEQSLPEGLEVCEFELRRYLKHLHVGPYRELPARWQRLREELATRGERIAAPSLEVYGHSCEGADESLAETTILIGLETKA